MRFTDFLDILGVLCLVALAFLIWPPAALGVLGVSCLLASLATTRRGERG